MSLFRPRHVDGGADVVGANLRRVQALLRFGRAACESKSKTARNLNQIQCTGKPGFILLLKTQRGSSGTFHRLVARENARFQNYASTVTGARDSARRALAICRIPYACASDQPSRAMHKLSMCRVACACASAAAATSAHGSIVIHLPTPDHPPLAAILG